MLRPKSRIETFRMGCLYVETLLSPEAKPQALRMVGDLRAAFRKRIRRADWMSA
jgi:predicted metalloendopeptidase